MKVEYSLTPLKKETSKLFEELDAGPDTIKFLEENIGRTISGV